jgi:hypothetical protein
MLYWMDYTKILLKQSKPTFSGLNRGLLKYMLFMGLLKTIHPILISAQNMLLLAQNLHL